MSTTENQKRELQPHGPTSESIPDYAMPMPYWGIDAGNKSGVYENWKLEYYGEKNTYLKYCSVSSCLLCNWFQLVAVV